MGRRTGMTAGWLRPSAERLAGSAGQRWPIYPRSSDRSTSQGCAGHSTGRPTLQSSRRRSTLAKWHSGRTSTNTWSNCTWRSGRTAANHNGRSAQHSASISACWRTSPPRSTSLSTGTSQTFWQLLLSRSERDRIDSVIDGEWIPDVLHVLLDLAHDGLTQRGLGEERCLQPLRERVARLTTPADEALKVFREAGEAGMSALAEHYSKDSRAG